MMPDPTRPVGARRYALDWRMLNGSWVVLDILSSLPIALIEHTIVSRQREADAIYGVDHMLKFARLARLFNMSRLSRGIAAKKHLGLTCETRARAARGALF